MALAIVFRAHENPNAVPTVFQLVSKTMQGHRRRRALRVAKLLVFIVILVAFNSSLDAGMMHNSHEELMVMCLNLMALGVAVRNMLEGPCGFAHASWEAGLMLVTGACDSLCWWGELFSPA